MRLARGDIADVLFGEHECLVLTSSECLRLSGVAAAILELLDAPLGEQEVRVALERRFGPAPDGAFEAVLRDLQRHGVIQVEDEMAPLADS